MEPKEMTMDELIAFVNGLDDDKKIIIRVQFGEAGELDEKEQSV